MSVESLLPSLSSITINKNPSGWGPSDIPEEYRNMPYQPFSKDTRVGKIADWYGNVYQDIKSKNRYTSQYGGGAQYTYYHDEDDTSYQTAGTIKPKTNMFVKNRQRMMNRNRPQRPNNQNQRPYQQVVRKPDGRIIPQAQRARQMPQGQNRKMGNVRQQDFRNRQARLNREPSIAIKDSWLTIDEVDLGRLSQLALPNLKTPLDIADFGELLYLDPSLDRINTKSEVPLMTELDVPVVSLALLSDEIFMQLASKKIGNVFMTSAVASFLMCSPRSVNSWDVIAIREENTLFMDFRNADEFNDPATMNETSQDPPPEDQVKRLTIEGNYCTAKFRYQALLSGPKAAKFQFPSPLPCFDDDDDDDNSQDERDDTKKHKSLGFRYRLFDLGNDIKVIIRCELDAAVQGNKKDEKKFACVYALNECPHKTWGWVDWRSKLDTQAGAVFAAELKNNSFRIARYTTRAILAGADFIKFGFITRTNVKDLSKQTILGVQQFKTMELAQQMNFNIDNAWGILRCIVEHLLRMPTGTYLIQKDSNKPILRFHTLPNRSCVMDDENPEVEEEDLTLVREREKKEAEERLAKINEALGSKKLGVVATTA